MNFDDLMAVWKSQDAAPLHDVNKTLLHLALRQDEAKLQQERRRERWIIYVFSAGMVAAMALFIATMIHFHRHRPEKVVTGWDYALPIVGAVAALLAAGAMYAGHRAQAWREPRFGESLRDQLNRSIAQLEVRATIARETLVSVLLWGICPTAILLLINRINDKSIGDDGYMLVTLTFILVWSVASSVWWYRRRLQREVLPRKRRLEALLKELDAS
jgi:hypothetical protein